MRKINIRNTIILMVLSLIIIPVISHAESWFEMEPDMENIAAAIGMELFVSMHMTLFVIIPLSAIISPNNSKPVAIGLSVFRAVFLLYFDFFVSPEIMVVDFFAVFVGGFIVVPIAAVIERVLRKDYYSLEKTIERENREIRAHVSNPINKTPIDNPINDTTSNSIKTDSINTKPDSSSNDSDDPIKFY